MSNKFTINKGDYIDSRGFTREELEKFCELAVECGHWRGEWMNWYGDSSFTILGVAAEGAIREGIVWSRYSHGYGVNNNITTQFRAYLDRKATPKSLLKDGMRLHFEGVDNPLVVVGDIAIYGVMAIETNGKLKLYNYEGKGGAIARLNNLDDNLVAKTTKKRVMKVTDRDGTVVWKRSEPLRLTLTEIAAKFNVESVEITNE